MNTPIEKFIFRRGHLPLLVSMPHAGEYIPPEIAANMTPVALQIADTDWHMPLLYDFLHEIGASVLVATHSRYVIDLNRPRDNVNLYPGQDTTGLCPIDTFHKEALYQDGKQPDDTEIQRRITSHWEPYHNQLQNELQRMRAEHGVAMLWDAHSIASVVPRFFEGRLPDLNLGTASGASCAPELAQQLQLIAALATDDGYSHALNGRFKGGHITRHYGKPEQNIHAVQLEQTQLTYMEEQLPFAFDEERAARVRPTLRRFLQTMLTWADAHAL
ncbi:N-formylglutamate deformylase [Collimonas arenae]|uniref:N-formylglutamate deformylase n=1 Tax=Collimonas arenae TaxID=279058 RepID=A0A127QIE0_9BURK|nr:N-formylglutamate deformylase [Collimonas arenae]AMO99877.1 N-formylglutamate deformylase [Collimonas arenae]AMP09774.1 N-formylglutamate deformylase [Collimonas arenae]